jgi:hypothetical protein
MCEDKDDLADTVNGQELPEAKLVFFPGIPSSLSVKNNAWI